MRAKRRVPQVALTALPLTACMGSVRMSFPIGGSGGGVTIGSVPMYYYYY